jgi:DNA-binding GntR family transcriptional regulator
MPQKPAIIHRTTVSRSVGDVLRQRIVEGAYAGGELIRQESLAEELGVSRIPIREALFQLESEGLVVIKPHKGAMVSRLSLDDAIEIFEARRALEVMLMNRATLRATGESIAAAEECLKAYVAAIEGQLEKEELNRRNWAFHRALYEPANWQRILDMVTVLHNSADRYLRLQIGVSGAKERALADHLGIMDAYRRRDAARASALLQAHIEAARNDVVGYLTTSQAATPV